MSYASTVLADSPVVFLQLDEASGTSAADSGSNAAAWTYQTGVTLAQTPVFPDGGTSVSPSGTASAAILSSVPASIAAPRGTSIEISVNLPSTSQKGAFVKLGSSNGWGVGVGSGNFDTAGNNFIVLQEGAGWYDSGVAIGTGAHHLVATNSSGGTISFYLDGSLVNTMSASTPSSATTALYLGGYSSRMVANTVRIDNMALYSSVLTGTQVSNHWAAIEAEFPPSPAALSFAALEAATVPAAVPVALSMAYVEASTAPSAVPRNLSQTYLEASTIPTNIPRNLSLSYLEVLTPAPRYFIGWGTPM